MVHYRLNKTKMIFNLQYKIVIHCTYLLT